MNGLPPLEITKEDQDWAEEKVPSVDGDVYHWSHKSALEWLSCRERQLSEALAQIATLTAQLEERTRQRDEWLARANKDIDERMEHEKHLLAEQERIGVIGSWPEGATQVVLVNKKAEKYLEELSMTCLRLESMYKLAKKTDADLDAERNLTVVMNKENLALVSELAELKKNAKVTHRLQGLKDGTWEDNEQAAEYTNLTTAQLENFVYSSLAKKHRLIELTTITIERVIPIDTVDLTGED